MLRVGLAGARARRARPAGRSPSTGWRSRCERRGSCSADAFVERLRSEGAQRYHNRHPFNVRMHAGRAHEGRAPALGRQPLLLPDANPHQGRDHRLEERGPRVPSRVDPAHRRPRRHEGGGGRARRVARPRAGPRPRRGRGAIVPRRTAGGSRRLRRVRRPRAHAASRRGGGVVAHRALRAGHHAHPRRRVGAALPVGRRGGARVLPGARPAGHARRRGGAGVRGGARDDARRAGRRACARSSKSAQFSGPCWTPSPSGRREAALSRAEFACGPILATARPCSSRRSGACASSADGRRGPGAVRRRPRRRRHRRRARHALRRRATPTERGSTATCGSCSPRCAARACSRATTASGDRSREARRLREAPHCRTGDVRRRGARRRAVHAGRRAHAPLPPGVPVLLEPAEPRPRPGGADHRRVAARRRRRGRARGHADPPERRRAARARRISRPSPRARAPAIST